MIRVLISDDHAILRSGLKEVLTRELPGVVCGEGENAREVLDQVERESWDLVLLDVSMPGPSGIEVLRDLQRLRPKLPVLVLSMHPEDQYGRRVLKAGAAGHMNKDVAPDELIKGIQKEISGGRYVEPQPAEKIGTRLVDKVARAAHDG